MGMPYRARINERTLLNLPGFHGGGSCTSTSRTRRSASSSVSRTAMRTAVLSANFEPRMSLEIADCDRTIGLLFDVDTPEGRENSLHKLETLEIAVRVFRDALVAEFEPYDRREQTLESLREWSGAPGGALHPPTCGCGATATHRSQKPGGTPTEGSNPSIRINLPSE